MMTDGTGWNAASVLAAAAAAAAAEAGDVDDVVDDPVVGPPSYPSVAQTVVVGRANALSVVSHVLACALWT